MYRSDTDQISVSYLYFVVQLTEEGVASLGQLSHLETLNVGQAGGVTDASVATICARGEESHIKSLVSKFYKKERRLFMCE